MSIVNAGAAHYAAGIKRACPASFTVKPGCSSACMLCACRSLTDHKQSQLLLLLLPLPCCCPPQWSALAFMWWMAPLLPAALWASIAAVLLPWLMRACDKCPAGTTSLASARSSIADCKSKCEGCTQHDGAVCLEGMCPFAALVHVLLTP
jgi:hypothetical protein